MLSFKNTLLALGLVSANSYYKDPIYEAAHPRLRKHGPRKQRNKDEKITVHLIAHTHDDVGWLKNVDQYYTGSKEQQLQQAEVNLIISEAVNALKSDPNRKFTYVEMKFFSMWWDRQDKETQDFVKKMVKEGRWEFVNAGWSMHDEAAPHYEDMINNMMKGHEFLRDTFDYKPRVGWHVDPFGHSNANPRLFADMGFEAWMFARLSYDDKDARLKKQAMNTLWRPFNKHFGNQKQIFTGIMQDHYCWASGFWYDERADLTNDDPFISDKRLSTFNADQKTKDLTDYLLDMHENYRGTHLMIPMGCDFTYANARQGFENMDRLIKYFNANNGEGFEAIYSTPGAYLDGMYSDGVTWPVQYDDMFPYADNPQDYWTGYFSSRAGAKKQVRDGQALLHSASSLYAQKVIAKHTTDEEIKAMMQSREDMLDAMGVYQHHDAVSGTAKQAVAEDYNDRLRISSEETNKVFGHYLADDMHKQTGIKVEHGLKACINGVQNTTLSNCPMNEWTGAKDQKDPVVVAYNGLGTEYKGFVKIFNSQKNAVASVWNGTHFNAAKSHSLSEYYVNNKEEHQEWYSLWVDVTIPPYSSAFIKVSEGAQKKRLSNIAMSSDLYLVSFSGPKALFKLRKDERSHFFNLRLAYYHADDGDDAYPDNSNVGEGAYLFKPERWERYQKDFAGA